MADAPSRAIVIFGDGLMPFLDGSHQALHSLASQGCCGFLALRSRDDTATEEADLLQLLDLHDVYKQGAKFQSMSERFMGMKASMITNSVGAASIGKEAGFSVSFLDEYDESPNVDKDKLPNADAAASKFLKTIGLDLSQSQSQDSSELLLLHLSEKDGNGVVATSWICSLTEKLTANDKVSRHLLLVVVFGYGAATAGARAENVYDEALLHLRPVQSSEMKSGKRIDTIRDHDPLLAVYHQKAVTRRDRCTEFTFEEIRKSCGNLTILADRFLYEVAFKLWKAPKYGA